MLKQGGSASTKISRILSALKSVEVIIKTPGQRYRGILKERIKALTEHHGATEQELQAIYNHIIMEILK